MAEQTMENKIGDLVRYEGAEIVTREVRTLTNSGETALSLDIGQPIIISSQTACGVCAAASIASMNALLLTKVDELAAAGTQEVALLVRGPAAVDYDHLPTTDYADAAITMATFVSEIEALGIAVRYEPDTQEEQTT